MASERSSGWLPGLTCIALSVVLWWVGQGWQEERQIWIAQAATTKRLLSSRETESVAALEAQRREIVVRREHLMGRLGGTQSLEVARAELVYDVRQRCYEIKLNCQIRLSDATVQTVGALMQGAREGDPLTELGIQRVRAVVSGTLTGQDISALTALFQRDPERQWRVNRVQLKMKAFEVDVERHLVPIKE